MLQQVAKQEITMVMRPYAVNYLFLFNGNLVEHVDRNHLTKYVTVTIDIYKEQSIRQIMHIQKKKRDIIVKESKMRFSSGINFLLSLWNDPTS